MEHKETRGPILCIKNCGFFGSAATMNMCSKCHKELVLQQEQAKSAASSSSSSSSSSLETIVNNRGHVVAGKVDLKGGGAVETEETLPSDNDSSSSSSQSFGSEKKVPSRCNTCRKRVGLTGFTCKCGNLFCSTHRYSDKHDCPFDYRAAARDALAKANPVIKADKVDKI
ncbi:hypothetical protein Dimus_001957 [Dionaea muscipula]